MLYRNILVACNALLLFGACQNSTDVFVETSLPSSQEAKPAARHAPSSAAQMTESAIVLLDSFSPENRATAIFALTDTKARTQWSNLPAALVERAGVRVGDLSDAQRMLLHDLLRASTSSQGYQKIAGIMWLDDILHEQSQERLAERGDDEFFARLVASWSSKNYWISFFGDPSTDADWGYIITGHHLAASFTVVSGQIAFTPTFMGAEPYEVDAGPFAGWRAMSHEVERGFELAQSLSQEQIARAVQSADIPRDVVEGPGRKAQLKQFQGIPASTLTADQTTLLLQLVREYVANTDHDVAEAHLAKINQDGPDSLFFSWIGPIDDIKKRYYYRVHGPSILIEYIRERGVGSEGGGANHIHTMVRDPGNDYGEDWLQMHYEEHHAGGRGPRRGPPR